MGTSAKKELYVIILNCLLLTVLNGTGANSADSTERCRAGEYQCVHEKTCIPEQWVCDGHPDCMDNDDEPVIECRHWKRFGPRPMDPGTTFRPPSCLPNEWSCGGSAQCIPIKKLCDGVQDCEKDAVDEGFHCTKNLFNPCDVTLCPAASKCKMSPEGRSLCYCEDGYMIKHGAALPENDANRLQNVSLKCEDMNECEYDGFCDQKCDNTVGSYKCSCVEGYALQEDKKSCKPVNKPLNEPTTILYQTLNSIRQIQVDDSASSSFRAFNLSAERIVAMDFDYENGTVCWIEMTTKPDHSDQATLWCAAIKDVTHRWPIPIVQALNNVADMAYDWLTKNWYFSDKVAQRILLCSQDGSMCRTLLYLDVEQQSEIRLDPVAGYLFMTTAGRRPKILRVGMDGRGLVTLVDVAMTRPRGLMLDLANRHIYWADNGRVQRISYNGTHRHVVHRAEVGSIYSLSILGNQIFAAEPSSGSIVWFDRRKRDRTEAALSVTDGLNYTTAIDVYHWNRQPKTRNPACKDTKCQQFCVPSVKPDATTEGRCLCMEGWVLENGTTCEESHPSSFLLYSSSRIGMIRGLSLDGQTDVMAPIDGLEGPVVMTVHVQERMIYYSSVFYGRIGRRRLDGRHRNDSYITKGIKQSEGIAIDWIARTIYWTDKVDRTITVARLDDPEIRKVIVDASGRYYPRVIVVDPIGKSIYWTYWSNEDVAEHETKIVAANLDGTGQKDIVASKTNRQYWPNGISLSVDGQTLYSVEAYYDHIKVIPVKSNQISKIKDASIKHPFSISVAHDTLYWTEMSSILAYNLSANKSQVIKANASGLFDVKVFNESSQPHLLGNVCERCTELCLRSGPTICVCGVGRKPTSDPNICAPDPNYNPEEKCSPSHFRCNDGSCIDRTLKCNGQPDCSNGEDEDRNTTCANHKCPDLDHMHQCTNNKCVPLRWLCDGEDDCQSGKVEDEDPELCNRTKCPSGDYGRCKTSGRCIPKSWFCDLDYDCPDKSDEHENCTRSQFSCPAHQFHCDNARCISAGFVCNQVDDCGDNSDEKDCRNECASTEFKCKNTGRCLPASYHCDGVDSCGDNSDEKDCAVRPNSGCKSYEFECGSGDCVPIGWRCDGNEDCENGADEKNCATVNGTGHVPCPSSGFGCVDLLGKYRCLSNLSRCDNIQDCKDNQDEINCPTNCPWPNLVCDEKGDGSSTCLDIGKVCDDQIDCNDQKDEGPLCGAMMCENHQAACSHTCHNMPAGYRCSCPANLTLDTDQQTCKALQPCGWGRCSQRCVQEGSAPARCDCNEGYELATDKFSCKPLDKRTPYIIFSNRHEIRRFDLGGSNYASLLSALPNTIALDFHYNRSYIFWTDVNEDAIYRGKMEGNSMSNVETIVKNGLAVTEGLAVDWIADNIYWVESQLDQIEVARLDGSNQTTLVAGDMDNPRAIAVDPRVGYLFWSDWHADRPRIERCDMDGENRRVIFNLTNLIGAGWPNGMTLDFLAKRVYWIDARSHSIHTIMYDGSDHRLVLKDQQLISHPFAISLFGDHLYWTDWKTNSLITTNKWNGSSVTQIQRTLTQPFDLHVYHSTRQPQTANPCRNNGNCSHLCLLNGRGGATCKCPALMAMVDGLCVELKTFLMYAEPKQIRGVNKENAYYNVMPAVTNDNLKVTGLDVDVADKRFYWTNMEKGSVHRSFINASLVEIVHDANVSNPESLAVDWSSRNLYFTTYNHVAGAIHVSSLDGAYRMCLDTSIPLNKPTSIALHPADGIMFVADTGLRQILRFNMDGSGGVPLKSGIEAASLIVDQTYKRLYWLTHDEGKSLISSANLDLSTHYKTREVPGYVHSIGVTQGVLYYAAKSSGPGRGSSSYDIMKVSSLIPKAEPELVRSTDTPVVSIKMFDSADQPKLVSQKCQGRGGCGQLCLLSRTSGQNGKVCHCTVGYRLGENGQCTALQPFLLYSTTSQLVGRELSVPLGSITLPPVSDISNISAIDYNPATETIFWVDSKTTEITRIQRDLTGREVIVKTGPDIVEGLAVDWQAENVYWTDQAFGTVQVARADGKYRYVLVSTDLEKPRAIVVHPDKGLVFWADVGQGKHPSEKRVPRIERSNLDGSNRRIIFNATDRQLPYGLALEPEGDYLVWCDRNLRNIMRMGLEGEHLTTLKENVTGCYHVAVDDHYVYWTSREINGKMKTYNISRYQSDQNQVGTTTVETVLAGVKNRITDLKIYSKHTPKTNNPCSKTSKNRKFCDQLCFFNGKEAKCACAYGKLAENGTGCVDRDDFLLFSSIHRIESINLENIDDRNHPIQPISNASRMRNVIGLAFHHPLKRIFFSDINQRNIQQVYFNGTGMTVVAKNVGSAEGLAYEEIYNRLYWTSYTNSSIKSVDLDTGTTKANTVVQLSEDDHPRAIVVDSCKSRMFWTNWNSKEPCIQRATLQGWDVQKVISTDIRVPNGLTIDHRGQRLYWSDARLDKIERCDFDGKNRKIIVSRIPQHVFALAHYGDYLYWTDWIMHSVVMASKYDGAVVKTLRKTEQQPMGIVAVAKDTNNCSSNPCAKDNGGCVNGLCSVDDHGLVVCQCYGEKKLLDDGKTCKAICENQNDFQCKDKNGGGLCLPLDLTCDGKNDCADGEDEESKFCNTRLCPDNYYRCHNHRCIQWNRFCDGLDDCGDRSDEPALGCSCPKDKFLCSSSSLHCIDRSKRCDRHPDCPQGEDEMHCPKMECKETSVSVKAQTILIPCNTTTACISPSWRCDGENDCWDNSDEQNCAPAPTCTPDEFQCKDDKRCISAAWKCDKTADCADQSDEADCGYKCSNEDFRCKTSGVCINKMWECDGQPDCVDGSDEHEDCKIPTTCPIDFFKCNVTSHCIPNVQVCDGRADCEDSSDESSDYAKCAPRTCRRDQFQCGPGSSRCVDAKFLCDRYKDCQDGEDEQQCNYKPCDKDKEFECQSGQCIPLSNRCDGYPECFDLSDEAEALCKDKSSLPCGDDFQCKNGTCLRYDSVCDMVNDCGDWSDELRCGTRECQLGVCDHHCEDLKLGYRCSCNPGYQLQSNGRQCKEIDECTTYNLCSHYCQNTEGSYKCSCMEGFALERDRRTCKFAGTPKPYLTITNRYYMRNMDLSGVARLMSSSHMNAVAVDFDWRRQTIYWSDVTNDKANISRMFFNGTGVEVLHNSTLKNPDGIAFDWYGDNIYWCDKTTDTIEVSKSDGRFRKVLVNTGLQEPRALVVHPSKGYLFYTDWGHRAHLGRIGMDGSKRRDLITDDVGWPNALTIDYVRDKIYWADARLDYIKMADLDGRNKHTIIKADLPHVFALTVFGGDLYWTDWELKAVSKANKLSGSNQTIIRRFIHRPMDIAVIHPSRQIVGHVNPCGVNNGGCEYLCLIKPGGRDRTCACPENHILQPNGVSCVANCTSSQFLCESRSKCIPFWTHCDGQNDCGDGSDEVDCEVYHCSAPGLFQCHDAEVTGHCIAPSQICDGEAQCADKSDELSFCANYTCMSDQFKCTVDSKCIPETRRCDGVLDCRGGEDEHGCENPLCDDNHIMCKEGGKTKCIPYMWKCDAAIDCDDGSDEPPDCKLQKCKPGYFKCEKTGQCLPDAWKCDGQNDCADGDKTDEPEHCLSATCEPTYFKCNNTRCIPGRWRCDYRNDCGDNSDEKNCVPRNCSESEFKCVTSKMCIAGHWRCNGEPDCPDGSDEQNCTNVRCAQDEFRCEESNFCIPNSWRCDGRDDCVDNSDELGCNATCAQNEFRCATTGQCIPAKWKCDGMADCLISPDDELNCTDNKCTDGRFGCGDGTCILTSQLCDGVLQCQNKADEQNCVKKCSADQFSCVHQGQCVNKSLVCDGHPDCPYGSDEDERVCRSTHPCERCETGRCYSSLFGGGSFLSVAMSTIFADRCACPNSTHLDKEGAQCQAIETCRQHGTCDQLCIPYRGSTWTHKCLCEPGYNLVEPVRPGGLRRCVAIGADAYILAMTDRDVYAVNSSSRNTALLYTMDEPLEAMDVRIGAVNDITIFGLIGRTNKIVSVNIDVIPPKRRKRSVSVKRRKEINLNEAHSVKDLAVDWIGKRIYFTDPGMGSIDVVDFNGTNVMTINSTGLSDVDQIAVNPYNNSLRLFWTQTGKHPRIESSYLDGSDRRLVEALHMIKPTDLAIDYPNQRLYWVDVKKKSVETINFDGSDRQIVKAFNYTEDPPYKIDVFETYVYVTTYAHRRLLKMNKFNSSDVQILDAFKAQQHIAVQPVKQRQDPSACDSKPCKRLSGSLCFSVPNEFGYVCRCPNGKVLVKNKCLPVKAQPTENCTMNLDYCLNGGQCRTTERNRPKCHCVGSYVGERCEEDACHDAVCLNQGQCSLVNGTVACRCPLQYSGPRCEVDKCHGLCQKNGHCVVDATGIATCRCGFKHRGPRCNETRTDYCQDWCFNGGLCRVDNDRPVCTCPAGTTGSRCENCTSLTCANNGRCLIRQNKTPVCSCLPGYTSASLCQKSRCQNYCQNDATCSWSGDQPVCQCLSPQFSGLQCQNDVCANFCHNEGTCTYDKGPRCSCTKGFTGTRCEKHNFQCTPTYCLNGGQCNQGGSSGNQLYDSVRCECPSGYGGKQCEIVTECYKLSCKNGGVCYKRNGEAYCNCTSDWRGSDCSVPSIQRCHNYCFNDGMCQNCTVRHSQVYCNCKCVDGWTGGRCERRGNVQQPSTQSKAGITTAIAIPFIIVLVLLLGVAIYFIRKRHYHTKLFSHIRMSDTGTGNVEISNPIYRPGQSEEDESAFMFDDESATNFSNPLYGSPFGDNAALPNEERRELLENDQLKVTFNPDDDNANNRTSFA